jgi:hypothetical protein
MLADTARVPRWGLWNRKTEQWEMVPVPTHQGMDYVMVAIACESRDEVEDIVEALRTETDAEYEQQTEFLEPRELVYCTRPPNDDEED